MRIALSANGPGEVAGWLRPLLRRIYERAPETEVHIFLVPDDYATGFEAGMARGLFPQAHVYDPKTYVKFALGREVAGAPKSVDLVQYLGGDLLHAARLHARLKGRAATYKFSRKGYRSLFDRAFAVDEKNVEQLERWQTPADRIERVGNLAIDGALLEAQALVEPGAPEDGILVMPGSRPYEVENLIPFYFTTALRIAAERPGLPISFGLSPFTSFDQVRAAVEKGGDPRVFAQRGRLAIEGDRAFLESEDGNVRFPIVHNALSSASRARLVLTLPGTKCIELAILGTPVITITPLNAPELVTVNGPLTYLHRIPLIGVPLKRAVAVGVSNRFKYHTQPNMDANEMVICEIHGTVTPGRVARVALERYDDRAWIEATGKRLRALYQNHVGAAARMAESILSLTG
jgi:lipid A disaccharide synthetase